MYCLRAGVFLPITKSSTFATSERFLTVTGDNRLTGMPPGGAVAALAHFGHAQFEVPYGMTIPACYALVAQRYMHDYAVTREDLAAIAVTQRRHALRHPKAHMKKPLTVEDVCTSRLIASPLRLFDCAPNSDGGAAVVVSTGEAVPDLRDRPVAMLGAGQKHTHEHIVAAPSLTDFGCKESSAIALREAGVTVHDIDVAEIYDSFTITLLLELESIGYSFPDDSDIRLPGGLWDLDGDGRRDLITLTLDFSVLQAVRVLVAQSLSIGLEFQVACQQPDGTFVMKTSDGKEGAAVGVNSVRVTCFTGQKPGANAQRTDEEASLGRSLIPHHYNQFSSSGLSVDVQAESNEPFLIEMEGP